MRCDMGGCNQLRLRRVVSIPIGFSDALRPFTNCCSRRYIHSVSIPIGFSDALRQSSYRGDKDPYRGFQSLLVFLMRCDRYCPCLADRERVFQSLLGFLMRCDPGIQNLCIHPDRVSIPIGFSDALRPGGRAGQREPSQQVSIPIGFSDALRLQLIPMIHL